MRSSTRESVHLVTRGHFRSRDKDSVHIVRSAITENPMLHALSYRTGVIADQILHPGNRDFGPFLLL